MVMVKAFGYGWRLEIAKLLEHHKGITWEWLLPMKVFH
jgi:hypothetical protein